MYEWDPTGKYFLFDFIYSLVRYDSNGLFFVCQCECIQWTRKLLVFNIQFVGNWMPREMWHIILWFAYKFVFSVCIRLSVYVAENLILKLNRYTQCVLHTRLVVLEQKNVIGALAIHWILNGYSYDGSQRNWRQTYNRTFYKYILHRNERLGSDNGLLSVKTNINMSHIKMSDSTYCLNCLLNSFCKLF